MNKELASNEYNFCVHPNGYLIKTKSAKEFKEFLTFSTQWLFKGVVKNNQYLHYKIGNTWFTKAIKRIYTSKVLIEKGLCDDTEIITPHHSRISKCQIGGKQKPLVYESL